MIKKRAGDKKIKKTKMKRKRRKRIVRESLTKKKRRKVRKKIKRNRMLPIKNDNIIKTYIINIRLINKKVTIIGRDSNGLRSVWSIDNFHPYFYYKGENESYSDFEDLENEFIQRYSNCFKLNRPNPINIKKIEHLYGKALFGYEKRKSRFLKICLVSEYDRIGLVNLIKFRKLPNMFETSVSSLERFLVDNLRIRPGICIKLPKGEINGLKNINEHYIIEYSVFKNAIENENGIIENERMKFGTYRIMSFKPFVMNNGETYPVAKITDEIKRERFNDSLTKTHEIIAVVCVIKDYSVKYEKVVREKRVIVSSCYVETKYINSSEMKEVKREKNGVINDMEVFTFNGKDRSKNEIQVIQKVLYIMKTCDIVIGFKVTDPYCVNSIQYFLGRLSFLGRYSTFLDNESLIEIAGLLKPKGDFNKNCVNPFNYTILLDILEYANRRDYKEIKNDCFENVYIYFMNEEVDSDRKSEEYYEQLQIRKKKPLDTSMIAIDIFKEGFESCGYKLKLFFHQKIFENIMYRSSEWGLDANEIWLPGSTKIFRFRLLRTLSKMKIEERDEQLRDEGEVIEDKDVMTFIVCSSENMFHARRRSDNWYIDTSDSSRGGRILKPVFGLVNSPIIGVDADSHYPTVVINQKLDYTNMFSSNEISVPDIRNMDVFEYKIGMGKIGFVQIADKYLPLVRMLKELRMERNRIKRELSLLISSSREGDKEVENKIKRFKILEKVVKRSLVSFTGCLSSTFSFIFRNNIIGETMRSIGRKVFDLACEKVSNSCAILTKGTDETSSVKIVNKLNLDRNVNVQKVISFKVVAGHTDGFDIMVSNGISDDLTCDVLKNIGTQICFSINMIFKNTEYNGHPMFRYTNNDVIITKVYESSSDGSTEKEIRFKVDYILKKAIYFNPNSKITLDFNDSINFCGSFNNLLSICDLLKRSYFTAVNDVFNGVFKCVDSYVDSIVIESIDKVLCGRGGKGNCDEDDENDNIYEIDEIMESLIQYERATEKMHKEKHLDSRRYTVSKVLNHFQKKVRYEYEIPAVNQLVPFIWINISDREISAAKKNLLSPSSSSPSSSSNSPSSSSHSAFPIPPDFFDSGYHRIDKRKYVEIIVKGLKNLQKTSMDKSN